MTAHVRAAYGFLRDVDADFAVLRRNWHCSLTQLLLTAPTACRTIRDARLSYIVSKVHWVIREINSTNRLAVFLAANTPNSTPSPRGCVCYLRGQRFLKLSKTLPSRPILRGPIRRTSPQRAGPLLYSGRAILCSYGLIWASTVADSSSTRVMNHCRQETKVSLPAQAQPDSTQIKDGGQRSSSCCGGGQDAVRRANVKCVYRTSATPEDRCPVSRAVRAPTN